MDWMIWLIAAAAVIAVAVLVIAYVCYRMAFYEPDRVPADKNAVDLPEGDIYVPFYGKMEKWTHETRALPCEEMTVTSFDGLRLYAKYYEYAPGAPIELMFHGYRGTAERDLSGGVQRCFKLGRSALIVDQRCSGKSEGHTITFGVNEHRDCLTWVDSMLQRFGPDVRILLTGISMGASTVLMAAGKPLPPQVVGVLADCGFSSAKEIIQIVIGHMGLPPKLAYPFVKLGARLYGHFDLEETSAVEAMATCTVPVIFFHGEDDAYVPCEMSRVNYEACAARKRLVTVPGAGHGLSYPVWPERYLQEVREFFGPELAAP